MGVRSNDAAELYLPFEEVAQPTKGAAQKAGDRPAQWTVGRQEVVLGDCLVILRELAALSTDVIVTLPPYNIGVAYRSYDDRRPAGLSCVAGGRRSRNETRAQAGRVAVSEPRGHKHGPVARYSGLLPHLAVWTLGDAYCRLQVTYKKPSFGA